MCQAEVMKRGRATFSLRNMMVSFQVVDNQLDSGLT